MSDTPRAHQAIVDLAELLQEASTRWASDEWNLLGPKDFANGRRALMHILEGGLIGFFETDPARPGFRPIVSSYRKFTGDNADALYYDTPVSAEYEYVVRGRIDGAVYTSFTVELHTESGVMATETAGVLNDVDFDVDAEGRFEIHLGGEKAERNWLELPVGASRITTRHYWENERCAAADHTKNPLLTIEVVGGPPVDAPPPPVSDDTVADGIEKVATFIRSRTLEMPPMAEGDPPPFVSKVPNVFPQPIVPGDFGLAAIDAHYSMAPYLCPEGQAVVITGRWPECRMANLCLWNRQMQTLDYVSRQVSLNRAQTQLEADGSWRMVIAHEDPGVPNWIDTEGHVVGIAFFRFMLAEGEVVTPQAEVVPLESLRG